VTTLTEIFKPELDESRDNDKNDKLVDLFRNRSELKKKFASLRDEKYKLQDRIKQQQGETAHVQQQIDHLENLLSDREWAHNVVVFYQLRWLSAKCSKKLAKFAEQLKQQRERRAHGHLLTEWNEQRGDQAAAVQARIAEQRMNCQLLDDRLQAVRNKLMAMNSFVKLFRKKNFETEIRQITTRSELLRTKENELQVKLREIENIDLPDPEGLDIASKRKINFMILSFAQQLYLHFEDYGLAAMAKESAERSVGAVNYGSKYECDEIVERITKRLDSMDSVSDSADVLQKRAKLIEDHAIFKNDDDVVPAPGSVATVYSINTNGLVREKDVSLLGDNYFAVANELSR
jgi:hypothetical protein